jgi:16S rRNA (guanine527-N7)-methyltransferase
VRQELRYFFYHEATRLGINLDKTQLEKFSIYLSFLIQEGKKINITHIHEERDIIIKHFLDSLSWIKLVKLFFNVSVCDVGSGAGFPGIPCKIYYPEMALTVIDSRRKCINFLYKLKNKLGCEFEILEGRVEIYGQSSLYREKYDIVVSRAVAKLGIIAEYCLPLVKVNGVFIVLKGKDIEKELKEAEKGIHILGGYVDKVEKISLISEEDRCLVKIIKREQTPPIYPRRPGVPEKKPLNIYS